MPRRAPPAAQRQRDPERTRQRILEAATAEFAEHGYAGARISRIAERSGMNKQLISYYFGGKEGLYRAIGDLWLRSEADAGDSYAQMSLPELAASYLRNTSPEMTRLFLWEGLTAHADDPGADARNARMTAAVEDIARRQAAGELADDIDPRAFLLALMGASNVVLAMPQLVRSIFGADAEPESAEFADAYADQIARIVAHLADPAPRSRR
jgi:TetR/AcrR family transcriptional regulator